MQRDCTEGEDESNCTAQSTPTPAVAESTSLPSAIASDPGSKQAGKGGIFSKNTAKNHKRFKYGYINNRNKI